jgi:hypothetical protein
MDSMSGAHPLAEMSYLFAEPPGPDRAMARLEIVTCGGTSALSMPAIRVSVVNDSGMKRAEIDDAGRTWSGEGESVTAAVLALLAGRIGYRAVVIMKELEEQGMSDNADAAARAAGIEVTARVRYTHRGRALIELPGEDELVECPAAEVAESAGVPEGSLPGRVLLVTVRETPEEGRVLSGFRLG